MKTTFFAILFLISTNLMAVTYEASFIRPEEKVEIEFNDLYAPTKIVFSAPFFLISEEEKELDVFMIFYSTIYARKGDVVIRIDLIKNEIIVAHNMSSYSFPSIELPIRVGKSARGSIRRID